MTKHDNLHIDEEALRSAIIGQLRHGSVLDTEEDAAPNSLPAPVESDLASAQTEHTDSVGEVRRRRMKTPQYEQTFMRDFEIKQRAMIYCSEEVKRKLVDVVQLLGRGNLSLTAYVDHILRHHLDLYKDEINRLHKERNSQNIL